MAFRRFWCHFAADERLEFLVDDDDDFVVGVGTVGNGGEDSCGSDDDGDGIIVTFDLTFVDVGDVNVDICNRYCCDAVTVLQHCSLDDKFGKRHALRYRQQLFPLLVVTVCIPVENACA